MAAGLAAEIHEATGLSSELVAGSGGAFVVEVDGKPIFSRKEQKPVRFPMLGEISGAIKDQITRSGKV